MIFGLDHVTLVGAASASRLTWLAAHGYTEVLRADGIDNLPLKRPWLDVYQPTHTLRLFRARGQAGIEIVDHGVAARPADRLLPILARDERDDASAVGETGRGPIVRSRALGAAVVRGVEPQDAAGPTQFVWRTHDVIAARDFWPRLGFKVDSINPDRFRFRGMDGVECTLWVEHAPEARSTVRLDAEGFSCLALVSTSIAEDAAALGAGGARVSEIGTITPGAHALRVGFVEAPDGAVVELIGLR